MVQPGNAWRGGGGWDSGMLHDGYLIAPPMDQRWSYSEPFSEEALSTPLPRTYRSSEALRINAQGAGTLLKCLRGGAGGFIHLPIMASKIVDF